MTAAAIIALVQGVASGLPALIKAVKAAIAAGKDPGDVKLSDFMSSDALDKVKDTNEDIEDYIKNG
jgi:hypothetical protein